MEKWNLVNEKGVPVNITWDRSRHDEIPNGLYHPCVEVWVKIGDKLLITQRHPEKSEPLKFDLPGGAVVAGEDTLTGAIRELYEEVGISATPDSLIELGERAMGKVYAVSYMLCLDELPPLRLQETEVVGYKLVSKEEFEELSSKVTRGTHHRYSLYQDQIFKKEVIE